MFQTFLSWYLSPWRRIPRWEFGVAITIATLPGLVISLVGFGGAASGFLGPLMDLMGAGQNLSQAVGSGNLAAMQGSLGALSSLVPSGSTAAASAWHFDGGSFFNALLLLALVPLCRMRLRDMGYLGTTELTLTVLFNISAVGDLIQAATGANVLPFSTLLGFANFGGYAWLCMAPTKAREAQDFTTPMPRTLPTPKPTPEDDEPPRSPFV